MSDQALQVMQRDYLGIPGDLSTPLFGQEFIYSSYLRSALIEDIWD
jgi:hypothetical protein